MERLARPLTEMRPRYDVVVVGSGYGGGVAACRAAEHGRTVCVLERGREHHPGDFPSSFQDALNQMRITRHGRPTFGQLTDLWDLRIDDHLAVLSASGLGGTSLVNAGVAIRPDDEVFADSAWPSPLHEPDALDDGFQRALCMLQPAPMPGPEPLKLERFTEAAGGMDPAAAVERPPLTMTFAAGPNRAGVDQSACTMRGDCVTGCNEGAKTTVLNTYLATAAQAGVPAEMFTQVRVVRVERPGANGPWVVWYEVLRPGSARFHLPLSFVLTDQVVLAAGALGSTEILLRSARGGLPVSPRIGSRLSGNGDVLTFVRKTAEAVHGVGVGAGAVDAAHPIGPTITGMARTQGGRILMQEGAIPGALRSLLSLGSGDLEHTLTLLTMADDEAAGTMALNGDALRLSWPGYGTKGIFTAIRQMLLRAATALGGEIDPDAVPLVPPITVHPLGGCPAADDAARGVVDHLGTVFDPTAPNATHEGLRVLDASIVPRALGVNPLLTITALAERACGQLFE